MRQQTILKGMLSLLMALVCNVAWAQTATINASMDFDASKRPVYRIKSKNGYWMTSCTSLGDETDSGLFAIIKVHGDPYDPVDEYPPRPEYNNAYKIYSVERQKWVSYSEATEYTNGPNKVILVDTRAEANPWEVTQSGDYYLFAPYLSNVTVAGFYWNWHGGIGSNPSNNVTTTVGFYNSNSDGGSLWTLSEVEDFDFTQIVDLNGTFTDQIGQEYSCTYKGIPGKTKPIALGSGVASISNEVWNGNSYTANITFPFMPSNAEITNHVVISPYNNFANKYYASGTDVKSYNGMNTALPTDVKNYLWAFYPTFTDDGFKVKIKNIGTGMYIFSDPTAESHGANDVSLKAVGEASSFTIIGGNQIINESGKYLSVPSSGSGQKDVGNYHKDHNGTKNKFVDANNYTLTLSDESTYSGTNGVHNVQGGNYTYTDGVWNENGYSAKVDFNFTSLPFPVSSADKVNPTMISSFNEGAGGYGPGRFKWYAAKDDDGDDDVKIKRDALVTEELLEAYSWAIYPSMENGAFAYSIKNVALGKYIQATKNFGANAGDNNEGTIILSDTPTKFSVDSNNSLYFFANERNQYLSLGSSGTTEGFLGIHTKTYAAGHKGITNAFLTPRYALASKDELKSGGIYTFLTARGWVGATDSENVIATANTAVTPAASTENAMFQWALYQSKNGNYYLYNLGKKMFMGDVDQSVNEGDIPFAASPMNRNMAFKNNAQAANFPIMFSTNNIHAVSQNTAKGLFAWKGGWNNNDEGSNHQVSYIGELDAEQLKTIADLVEAYDKSMPMKVEVEGSWENNPNTHFGNLTVTTGSAVTTTKLTLENMEVNYVEYTGAGDIFSFTREYRGFEFQGFFLGEESLGKSFTLTEEQEANITEQNPLVAKFTATEAVTLFYDDDEFSYRIPAIATTSTGRLIAVSDYRHSLDDIGRYNFGTATPGIDLVIRTSDDNGKTWSATKTIAKGSGVLNSDNCAYGDAAIAVVGQKVLVMGAAGDVMFGNGSATAHNRTVRIFSEDNGVTWSAPQDISETFFINADATINSAYSLFFGSGKLAVDENYNGTGKARIYGAVLVKKNGIGNGIYVVYTDDFGLNWSILGGSQTHITANDEPKVEILPSGQILLSVRRGGGRQFNVFTYSDKATNAGSWNGNADGCGNGGKNTCNGEIFLVDAKNALGEDVKLLLQSQPKGGGGLYDRRDVTIWYKEVDNTSYTSSQIAGNWIEGMQVSTQQSAYSTMSLQEDGKIAFFFEEAPCYGDDQAKGYCMVYMPLTIEEITKNKYFSLDADFSTEVTINVELTDAQGNKYRDQLKCALPDVATTLTTKYSFITLGEEAKLSAQDGAYSYTNKVTLPFHVSNTKLEIWHHIYFPINTNEYNYPAYMAQGNPIVSIVTESAVYGNSTYNTRAKADEISWAIYQSADGAFSFILKNKYRNQYLYTTAAATTATKVTNVQYTDDKAKASAFVPSTEGRNPAFQGEYSLKVGNGYICVTAVANGYVTYSTNRNHKGAWAKFEVVPNYTSLINEVNATLKLFGTGLSQYATTSAATAAQAAMKSSSNVKLNALNTYKDLTKNATLNMPKAGQYFRIKGISGNYIDATSIYNNANAKTGQMSMKSASECNYKGTIFYLDENNYLVNYATGTCIKETREIGAAGDAAGKWTFAESPRKGAGKYALSCTTTNNNGANLHDSDGNRADRCSNNCGTRHDFTLEEVTALPVSIGSTGFGTLYAPVALTLPEGMKAYTGTVSQEKGEYVLTLYEVKEAIPARTGVILQSETKNKDYEFAITTLTASSVENDLMGSVISFVYSKSGYQPYTLQTSTQSSSGVAFKRYNGASVTGGKVYIELPSTQNAAAVRVRFAGEDVTEIENSEFIIQDSEFIYDLTGRRVETMDKGVYIVNGKKVVIK